MRDPGSRRHEQRKQTRAGNVTGHVKSPQPDQSLAQGTIIPILPYVELDRLPRPPNSAAPITPAAATAIMMVQIALISGFTPSRTSE